MATLNLAVNSYAFHWSFPEILADSLGLFAKRGVAVNWTDATPARVANKTQMYSDLLRQGLTDVYHAGEWACINRVLSSDYAWVVAKSPPGRGTLNSSFSLYVPNDSGVKSPSDLAGKKVAIEEGTGTQYTTILDLEKFVKVDEVHLVQAGEPHRRLRALMDGEVDAASLVGPWADIGKALGFRMLLQTSRKNPTTIVVRKDTAEDLLRGFFGAVNEAIGLIDSGPEKYKELYFEKVKGILDEAGLEVGKERLRDRLAVNRWERWGPYEFTDFSEAYLWMVERGLAQAGRGREDMVKTYPSSLFL